MSNKLGTYIKEEREKKGISQRKLAEEIGFSNSELSRIESGERQKPDFSTLSKISSALDLDFGKIMKMCDIEVPYIYGSPITKKAIEEVEEVIQYNYEDIEHEINDRVDYNIKGINNCIKDIVILFNDFNNYKINKKTYLNALMMYRARIDKEIDIALDRIKNKQNYEKQ